MRRFYKADHFWPFVGNAALSAFLYWIDSRFTSGFCAGISLFFLAAVCGELWPKYVKRFQ